MADEVYGRPDLRLVPQGETGERTPEQTWGKRGRGVQRARYFGRGGDGDTLLVAWSSDNEPVLQLYILRETSEDVISAATEQLRVLLDAIDGPEVA